MGKTGTFHRYLIKYTVRGSEGFFWTDYRIWDVEDKDISHILQTALYQAKTDATSKLKKKVEDKDVDIKSFNLIDYVQQ